MAINGRQIAPDRQDFTQTSIAKTTSAARRSTHERNRWAHIVKPLINSTYIPKVGHGVPCKHSAPQQRWYLTFLGKSPCNGARGPCDVLASNSRASSAIRLFCSAWYLSTEAAATAGLRPRMCDSSLSSCSTSCKFRPLSYCSTQMLMGIGREQMQSLLGHAAQGAR